MITHSNKLECSDYTLSLLNEFKKAKKDNRNLMIPKDLIMTQFTKERGESQNMASESYAFIPNGAILVQKVEGKPKALSWSPEKVQEWFN